MPLPRARLRALRIFGMHPPGPIIGFAAVLCLFVVTATSWVVWAQRAAEIRQAGINLQNLSLAVADQVDRIATSLEYVEDRLLDHMRHTAVATDSEQFHEVMRDMVSGMSQAYALVLVDRRGNLVNRSHAWPPAAVNVADRGYFLFARAHPETPSFVSEVVVSRQTGRPTFNIIRRLSEPDGTFAGVLIGTIEVDYIQRLFGVSTLSEGGSVALFQPDGTLLVRNPPVRPRPSGREVDFRTSLFLNSTRGVIHRQRIIDDVDCLSAVSRLPQHPLYVVMSVPLSAILANWTADAVWLVMIAVLGCLATVVPLSWRSGASAMSSAWKRPRLR